MTPTSSQLAKLLYEAKVAIRQAVREELSDFDICAGIAANIHAIEQKLPRSIGDRHIYAVLAAEYKRRFGESPMRIAVYARRTAKAEFN